MNNRRLAFFLLGFGVLVIQWSIAPSLIFMGVHPDFLLVFCVSLGLIFSVKEALVAGAALGLVMDLLNGRFIGLFTVAYIAVGFLAGVAGQKVNREIYFTPWVVSLVGSLLKAFVILLLLKVGGLAYDSILHLKSWLVGAVLNGILTVALYKPMMRFRRWLMMGLSPLEVRGPWV